MCHDSKTQVYQQCLPIIRAIAAKISGRDNGWLLQELIEEGEYRLSCVASDNDLAYKAGRLGIKTTTYVYNQLRWAMLDHVKKISKRTALSLDEAGFVENQRGSIQSRLAELGEEAKIVIDLVFNAPAELSNLLRDGRKASCTRLSGYLLYTMGWDREKVRRVWREIGECLTD